MSSPPEPQATPLEAVSSPTPPRGLRSAHLWVSTTYFAEGFPYSVINNLAEILFKELGASLQVVGLTSLFHLPWNLKFLWGPFLDVYETKRRWLVGLEVVLTALMVVLALVASFGDGAVASPPELLGALAAVFVGLAFLSATHDIAIDGFYLEGLDEHGQSRFVGYRAMAYKIASLLVRGPLLVLVGWVGWSRGLLAAALVMAGLTAIHWLVLPRVEKRKAPLTELLRAAAQLRVLAFGALVVTVVLLEARLGWLRGLAIGVAGLPGLSLVSASGWIGLGLLAALLGLLALQRRLRARLEQSESHYAASFLVFLEQPEVGRILAFVVLFRTGESLLMKMKWPFLRDEMHMTLEQFGVANGTIGVIASFVATLVGGWLIARHGLKRWVWPFVLAQNLLNLLYAVLAAVTGPEGASLPLLTTVITLEHFGEGLGTAVFMVYLMRCCHPDHRASHMAIVTALMSVSFTVAGVLSGFVAEAIGFAAYFGLSFVATVPAMILLLFVPYLDGKRYA